MGHKFAEIAFTDSVKAIQARLGSRDSYASMAMGEDYNHALGQMEYEFIAERDSFYMASVSETGWPYVQHRGGPVGFVKILDQHTIGFADYSGNRQYVSVGNFSQDDRVSLFFMDYVNRRRLKLLGRVRVISLEERDLLEQLEDSNFRAQIERGIIITVEAFDWNCPQFITPRYSEEEVKEVIQVLKDENNELQRKLDDSVSGLISGTTSDSEVLGTGPLQLRVAGVRELTPEIRAYELHSADGSGLPSFEAGSHLRIPLRIKGTTNYREYSISSHPGNLGAYEIAVYREPEGRGGSAAIHGDFQIGTRFNTTSPINHFPLATTLRSTVLIAGGIGITPIKAMAHVLKERDEDFLLYYAGKSRSEMAYYDELKQEFPTELRTFCSDEGQRLDIASIIDGLDGDTQVYVCGPERLLNEVILQAQAKGIERNLLHFEKFE